MDTKLIGLRGLQALIVSILITACTTSSVRYEELYGPTAPQERTASLAEIKKQYGGSFVSYSKEVQPIFNQRCVVCHACYDAPCQLKFSSFEGLDRGATTLPVYNGRRFIAQEPTRLGIDATTTAQWREKGFYPVLNERNQNAQNNLDNSLLYKMLTLKRKSSFPTEGRLPKAYDVGTELHGDQSYVHKQQCTMVENFSKLEKKHPEWGMPFAFPALSYGEFKTIETWLKQGGLVEPKVEISNQQKSEVKKWEAFFNGSENKQRLMSRYLYEHLFLGHLYFDTLADREYYELVRSRTPPGEPIDIIASVWPYDDPGVEQVYYRLKHYNRTIVSKTHLPYTLNDKKMARMKALFLDADYTVEKLPGYEVKTSANPFKAFAAIPSKNRYKFMLDDAHFFINGFIKGPVCRGSIALSVIDDHFWVAFFDPDNSDISSDSDFLAQVSGDLRMPSEEENSAAVLAMWMTYSRSQNKYMKEKVAYLTEKYPGKYSFGIDQVWDGDKVNKNAALTVYRHYGSATVLKGFVGEVPKTGWIIDYPILERIHYLLVAGFDVYGTLPHQLSARLYMDFLRVESELYFLQFLPADKRVGIYEHWYRGTKRAQKYVKNVAKYNAQRETAIKYESEDVKTEFFIKLHRHLKDAQKDIDYINLCSEHAAKCEAAGIGKDATYIQKSLKRISAIGGEATNIFPNVSMLRIVVDGTVENDLVYTILRNKAYLNNTSLIPSEKMRIHSEDSINIVEGFVGAYPNFFLQINRDELDQFIELYESVDGFAKYNVLIEKFGIRRTNPNFWETSDWFHKKYQHDYPDDAGILDLSRYQNR